MNILKHTLVVCSIMALGGMLGGCSMLNSGSKPSRAKAEKDAEMVLPRDREQLAAEEEVRTYTSEDIKRGVVKGDWAMGVISLTGLIPTIRRRSRSASEIWPRQ